MEKSMIDANSYSVSPYRSVYPVVSARKTDAQDAADFEKLLKAPAPAASAPVKTAAPKKEGFSFLSFIKGLIDIINPLQHIPIVGAIYRHLTGDEMSPVAKLVGDTLYGGPIGAAVSVADLAYEKATGKDFGETVIAGLSGDEQSSKAMVAQNLDQISPAAGKAVDIREIIWADNISPAGSPLFLPPAQHAGTKGVEPVPPSTYLPPVLQAKGNVSTSTPRTEAKVGSTAALHMQEAPAGDARTAVPPELIASKMMEALDKYKQMKINPLPPVVSIVH